MVEKSFSIEIQGHPVVASIGGTVDYIGDNCIHDVKTSKRMTVPSAYAMQQTVYALLCEHHKINIEKCYIQGIILKAQPEGCVQEVHINKAQVLYIINSMLDALDLYSTDMVDPDTIFGGNPKYYLCTPKYCGRFSECSFVNG